MKKRLVTLVLMLCMALCLVACGGNGNDKDTEKNNTENTQQDDTQKDEDTESESESEETGVVYTIKVVDEANNPMATVMVQLCKDTCVPKMTDANGEAKFTVDEIAEGYKANVTVVPDGYTYDQGDVYFEDGATEVVLVLKAAQ